MKKIIAILILLLVTLNSVGLTFGTHYCGGKIVKAKLMIGYSELDCGMNNLSINKVSSQKKVCVYSKSCCKNMYYTIDIDETVYQKLEFSISEFQFLSAIIQFHFNLKELKNLIFLIRINYQPPIWYKDIQVLFQSFLI